MCTYVKMGIKNLWTVISPFCEKKPLHELQGKSVAIDLSCWICEAQNIAEYQVQPRMYLRNLYFRTCYLLLMEVNPVFVLEGKAPELKYDTIAARNAIQFKGAKPKSDKVKTSKDRTRFNSVLKSCQEMLGFMGIACIKGEGEAESLCAYLNHDGLVSGCISQDSDCFAYGAQVVYRNFSISTQGSHAASGGSIDIYDIRKVKKSIDFGRNKIVAMALLVGCDYSDGIFGVGKDTVVKLFEKISDEDILDRLRSWRKKPEIFEELERKISDKNVCSTCGHCGKVQSHTRNGCVACGTTKSCNTNDVFKTERQHIKNELSIRSKALDDPEFPNENLIDEFLIRKDKVSELNLKWKKPDVVKFVNFTAKYLDWERIYAFEKILPILTRWQCINFQQLNTNTKGILFPQKIKKARNPKGVPSYEIIWQDPQNNFKNLFSDEELQNVDDLDKLFSTIEPQGLVEKAYPILVDDFKKSKIKPKKQSRAKKKKCTDVDNIDEMLKNTSISEPQPKKPRKPRVNKKKENTDLEKVIKKNYTVDDLFRKAISNNAKLKMSTKLPLPNEFNRNDCISSTPVKNNCTNNKNLSFNLTDLIDDDCDEVDLSNLIDSIVARKPPDYLTENLDDIIVINDSSNSFFINAPVENDIFEKTFDKMTLDDSDSENTEEYNYNKNEIGEFLLEEPNNDNKIDIISEDESDSFCDNYVPLYERLKNK